MQGLLIDALHAHGLDLAATKGFDKRARISRNGLIALNVDFRAAFRKLSLLMPLNSVIGVTYPPYLAPFDRAIYCSYSNE